MKSIKKIVTLALLALSAISLEATAQVEYDPASGTTYYPNGTIYKGQEEGGRWDSFVGVCVDNREKCQEWDIVDCNEDPETCRKILEEAADSAENGNNGGNTGDGNTEGGESEGAENQRFKFIQEQLGYSSKEWSILMKKMDEKPGMYQYWKGDWVFVKSPIEETKKIIAVLRKKGK